MSEVRQTIAAISTSMAGHGGIGIIRISGDEAISIADSIFTAHSGKPLSECKSHTIHYGVIQQDNVRYDEVLVMLMRAPNTYTREDVVEINCHGGSLVMSRILELITKNGARLAEAGEFTKRAFLNGRIDLSQAEAVIDVINAQNDYALKASVMQLDGKLSEKIREMRIKIMDNIAFIEAALDDPEHISLEGYVDKLRKDVDNCVENLQKMCKTAENGRIVTNGINTVILGKPNAGKSSLLNYLARQERAIVTDIEGTTRDILEEKINLDGITLNLMDTAGIRQTADVVEKIGVDRAKAAADNADLIVYVVDSSRPLDGNDEDIFDLIKNRKVIILLNKTDLSPAVTVKDIRNRTDFEVIEVSAKTGDGMEQFSDTVREMFYQGKIDSNSELMITNVRHKALLNDALNSMLMVKKSIEDNMPEDFFSIDLMSAYEHLGKIIGEAVEEDLVNTIFDKFCMGK